MGHIILLTSGGCGRQHDSLKPHGEEVYDGEVTKGNQEITGPNKDRDFLFEQKLCQNGLDGEFQFNN
jgi:hypothetical protein